MAGILIPRRQGRPLIHFWWHSHDVCQRLAWKCEFSISIDWIQVKKCFNLQVKVAFNMRWTHGQSVAVKMVGVPADSREDFECRLIKDAVFLGWVCWMAVLRASVLFCPYQINNNSRCDNSRIATTTEDAMLEMSGHICSASATADELRGSLNVSWEEIWPTAAGGDACKWVLTLEEPIRAGRTLV